MAGSPRRLSWLDLVDKVVGMGFRGLCEKNNSLGNDRVQMYVHSPFVHTAYASLTQSEAGPSFGSGDMTQDQNYLLADIQVPTGTPDVNPISGSVVAPDGKQIDFNLYQGVNARNQPGQCMFEGSLVAK
jgi:hypothetical protein